MGEGIKGKGVLILSVVTALFFVWTLGSCIDARRMRSARDKEMASRLDIEEKMSSYANDKANLENKLKKLENDLAEEKSAHELTKKDLAQEKLINQSLNDELQKVTKIKDALENDLKQVLATGKRAKK